MTLALVSDDMPLLLVVPPFFHRSPLSLGLLLISWPQSPFELMSEPKQVKSLNNVAVFVVYSKGVYFSRGRDF